MTHQNEHRQVQHPGQFLAALRHLPTWYDVIFPAFTRRVSCDSPLGILRDCSNLWSVVRRHHVRHHLWSFMDSGAARNSGWQLRDAGAPWNAVHAVAGKVKTEHVNSEGITKLYPTIQAILLKNISPTTPRGKLSLTWKAMKRFQATWWQIVVKILQIGVRKGGGQAGEYSRRYF